MHTMLSTKVDIGNITHLLRHIPTHTESVAMRSGGNQPTMITSHTLSSLGRTPHDIHTQFNATQQHTHKHNLSSFLRGRPTNHTHTTACTHTGRPSQLHLCQQAMDCDSQHTAQLAAFLSNGLTCESEATESNESCCVEFGNHLGCISNSYIYTDVGDVLWTRPCSLVVCVARQH